VYCRLAFVILAALLCGCAAHATPVPPNAVFGAASLTATPVPAPNDAPPHILAMRFSTADVRRGANWSGQIVTTTNVASVEVRTSLFSIDVPRTSFGRFAFQLHVLDVPPIFIRAYQVRVIARNSAGVEAEEDFPLRIR
jgi:hypothetical protein